MKDLAIWKFMLEKSGANEPLVFMCVMESLGSSPGRQGFKMAITKNELCGSIGGGIMEHKFVEMAKDLLTQGENDAFIKKQIHSKQSASNQSGMICSGEQTIVIYPVKPGDIKEIQHIVHALESNIAAFFEFSHEGIFFNEIADKENQFIKISDSEWRYTEKIGFRNHLHIIGGGHVALAFSKLMSSLDFYISVYDDRPELNTMLQNNFAHHKQMVDYNNIGNLIPDGLNQYIVVMTFGYRTDGIVLRQLLNKKVFYIGLLGSENKIAKMKNELIEEGVDASVLEKLHAPIGIQIKSQTPEEIAISIAAEIIRKKNSELRIKN